MKKILSINGGGTGCQDEIRVINLTKNLNSNVLIYNINKGQSRLKSFKEIRELINSKEWDLIYQEMTSISGGLNLILAAFLKKQKYIISSGDPVSAFFKTTKGSMAGYILGLYERLLYKYCTGFVGWTPYLTSRAIKLGAKRAVTVEGAVDLSALHPFKNTKRIAVKKEFGLNPNHLVCGVIGSLKWTKQQSYCYGLELIESLKRVKRKDISILIVGDGNGKKIIERKVPPGLRSRVIFTGKMPHNKIINAINAMDIGFITQTLDELGNCRLTTKLPEYLACGLPVAMSPIPGFYDYALPAGWALPSFHPASKKFHSACAQWLDELSWNEVRKRAAKSRNIAEKYFDYNLAAKKFKSFVENILGDD